MHGFTESYNLSVSAAVVLSALRTRLEASKQSWLLNEAEQIALKIEWCRRILNGGPQLAQKFREEYQKV
jgi:tRNA (guanosine-2'-O-)-methyltransferase